MYRARNTGSRASVLGSRSRRSSDPSVFSSGGTTCLSALEPASGSCVSGIYTASNNDLDASMHSLSIRTHHPCVAEPLSNSPPCHLATHFAPDTPTSASSSSSCQPLTPTSAFDHGTVVVMGEEQDVMDVNEDGIAGGYMDWDKSLYSGRGDQQSKPWNNLYATVTEPRPTDVTVSSISEVNNCPNDFDHFWDSLLPTSQQLAPLNDNDDRDAYSLYSPNTLHDASNSAYSSQSHVTSVPHVNTCVPPQQASSSSSYTSSTQYAPTVIRRQSTQYPVPLHQPQPIRPIPPIPLVDLTQAASKSGIPSSGSAYRVPQGTSPLRARYRNDSEYQNIHHAGAEFNLSENSLLCQPVSDTIRFQNQSNEVWFPENDFFA